MARHQVPSYRFEFRHGISSSGVVERTSPAIERGQVHRISYRLDDLPLMASLGRPIPARVADLIDVSVAIYLADRLALRKMASDSRLPADRWHRRIHVIVPVRHPDWWQRPEVIVCLQKLLSFLTDDLWSFEFVSRSSGLRQAETQARFLRPPDGEVAVALHSGGLDSLFGLADLVTNGHAMTVVPVTVVSSRRVRRTADSVTAEIRRSLTPTEPRLLPTRLHVEVMGIGRHRNDREPTQRARGILFLAIGVGVAVMAGTDRLQVCENGIGAISLPMTPDHWGAHATRAMHPKTLLLMSRLAATVLDQPILIENAGLFVTKGDLARRMDSSWFVAAARQTVSCDHTAYIGRGEACGRCTSCILRRVALTAAGLEAVVDSHAMHYRTDWFDAGAEWSSENAIHLTAMRHQVECLRVATEIDGGFAALDAAFPDLFDVVSLAPSLGFSENEVERCLLRLYGAYVREFDTFVTKIDRIGWGRRADVRALMTTFEEAATG